MNPCIFQIWEVSERGVGNRSDGGSIHIDLWERESFILNKYKLREKLVVTPKEYDRPLGNPVQCLISDELYNRLLERKSIRLFENEKNNLINMEELILNI